MTSQNTHIVFVSIPDCTATHVLGTASIPLTSGTLSLISYTPTLSAHSTNPDDIARRGSRTETKTSGDYPPSPGESSASVLTLQIGKLAFPLTKDTMFGTNAQSPRVYLFVPELGPAMAAAEGRGYIRLELPEQAQEPQGEGRGSWQDDFEQVLIRVGLLKEGWEAVKDDIQGGVRDTVYELKNKVSSGRIHPEVVEAPQVS